MAMTVVRPGRGQNPLPVHPECVLTGTCAKCGCVIRTVGTGGPDRAGRVVDMGQDDLDRFQPRHMPSALITCCPTDGCDKRISLFPVDEPAE